jgi:hypothetical protein
MSDIVEVMARRICGWAFRVIERPIDPYVDDKYDRGVATERVEEAMTAARSAIAALDAAGFAIVPKDEAAKVRAATIEECAKVAKTAWLTCQYGEIADADAMCALSEHTETAIRALAEK